VEFPVARTSLQRLINVTATAVSARLVKSHLLYPLSYCH
jgi:hypothetical protein